MHQKQHFFVFFWGGGVCILGGLIEGKLLGLSYIN
jgi:hypothetical protein